MISSQKVPIIDSILYLLLVMRLRKRFYNVCIQGIEHLQNLDPHRPTIAFSTHTNWWDGLLVFLLTRVARHKDFYCMMEEKHLVNYKFLTWLGAFSIDAGNPVKAGASMRYATRLLTVRENLLWLFPQGDIRSCYEKIGTESGTHFLANKANNAQMLPVAFHYEFFREERPHILIKIGTPFPSVESSPEKIRFELQSNLDYLLDRCKSGDLRGFEPILMPNLSINKKWEFFKLAFTGRIREFSRES